MKLNPTGKHPTKSESSVPFDSAFCRLLGSDATDLFSLQLSLLLAAMGSTVVLLEVGASASGSVAGIGCVAEAAAFCCDRLFCCFLAGTPP